MASASGSTTAPSASSCRCTVGPPAPSPSPSPSLPSLTPTAALTQLNHLKSGNDRTNIDAREALKWLDDITSNPAIDDRVQLEGVDEAYLTWDEVEKFLLPETLLSMEYSESEEDEFDEEYHEDLESSLNALDVSDETSMSSTHSLERSPKMPHSSGPGQLMLTLKAENQKPRAQNTPAPLVDSPNRTARNSTEQARTLKSPKSSVPAYLRPLFNHILWRINKESNPDTAFNSFILLTNDPIKQMIAQKFGVRAKRLEQLRDAVLREDREYKNQLAVYKRDLEKCQDKDQTAIEPKPAERPKSSHSSVSRPAIESDDEDEVLLSRAPRGPANPAHNQRVFDPNEFGRANQHHSPRGGRGLGPRGRGGHRGGRGGNFAPRGGAYVPPGQPFRPPPAPRHDPNRPIDPDSFTRPPPRGSAMRGTRRTLWEPNEPN